MRASDADRERASELLREHAVAGRLSMDELGDRLERAYAGRTYGELHLLLSDLPGTAVAPPRERRRPAPPRARSGPGPMGIALSGLALLLLMPALATVLWSSFAFAMMALMTIWMVAPFVLVAVACVWMIRRLPGRLDPPGSSWPTR